MTPTANRSFASILAAVVAAALWLPTIAVPAPGPAYAAAPIAVELA